MVERHNLDVGVISAKDRSQVVANKVRLNANRFVEIRYDTIKHGTTRHDEKMQGQARLDIKHPSGTTHRKSTALDVHGDIHNPSRMRQIYHPMTYHAILQ